MTLAIATVISAFTSGALFSSANLFSFFLPPLLWSTALFLPVYKKTGAIGYDFFALVSFTSVLWLITLILGALLLSDTQSNLFFPAPLLGAFAAACSYYLFSKLILEQFHYKCAILCTALGYLSVVTFMIGQGNTVIPTLSLRTLVLWQVFVGIGHCTAYYRRVAIQGN